jgi:cobalt-zinc-cadmium efflux system protein
MLYNYHVWTISNDMNALSCHAVVDKSLTIEACEQLLKLVFPHDPLLYR